VTPAGGSSMRQMVVTRHGPPSRLRLEDAPVPEPGKGELRIRVCAAGVNFADILVRRGAYPGGPRPPCVVGHEVAGIVDSVGEGVNPVWIGREVLAMTDYGGYADYHVIDAHRTLSKPDGLSLEHAAALPLNYVTAWVLLAVMGSLRQDQTVLIQNAGGGVGLAAVDVAKHVGARTFGTASARKHPFLLDRGVDQTFDYRQPDWRDQVMDATRGAGVDLIIDPLGPASWKSSLGLLGPAGRLGMFGISDVAAEGVRGKLRLASAMLAAPTFHPARLVTENRGVFGCSIHGMYGARGKLNAWLGQILKGVSEGWIRPHVDRCFDLEDAAKAQEYIEARQNIGKVILTTR
jgi:NADPH:quinone reductase-like Zn-dependent oxidoreductase